MKRGVVFVLGILFLISFASAETTSVHVKTMPYHEVQFVAFEPNAINFNMYDKFILTSNQYGDVFGDISVDEEFNVRIFIKKNNEKIITETYEDYEPGEEIYIEIAPSDFEFLYAPEYLENLDAEEEIGEVINETEEVFVEDEVLEESGSLTGNAVSENVGEFFKSKMFYYILGGVGGLVIIVIIVWFIMKKKKPNYGNVDGAKSVKVKKLSELKVQKQAEAQTSEELKQAEEELRKAQEKINVLKNKDRIEQLKQEIEAKEKELINLRSS
jgi:hypothetical protein